MPRIGRPQWRLLRDYIHQLMAGVVKVKKQIIFVVMHGKVQNKLRRDLKIESSLLSHRHIRSNVY